MAETVQCFGGPMDGAFVILSSGSDGKITSGIRRSGGVVKGVTLLFWDWANKTKADRKVIYLPGEPGRLNFAGYAGR